MMTSRARAHSDSNRVNRGGSWNNTAGNLRAANRNNNPPGDRNNNLGLRCASPVRRETGTDPRTMLPGDRTDHRPVPRAG